MCATVIILMIVCSLFSRCSTLTAVETSPMSNTESKRILHNALLSDKADAKRHVRSLTDPRQNCGKWSQWIDDHHPTLQDKGDREFMPPDKLDEFCPSLYGGHISKIMCRDNKGEPAFGNRTDGKIFIFCSDVNHGVTCSIVQQNIDDTCYDMAVQYFCNCTPITTAVQPLGVTSDVMKQVSTKSSSILLSGSTKISTDLRFRTTSSIGLSVSSGSVDANIKTENNTSVVTWWIIVLVVISLCVVIIVVSVCLRCKWARAKRARETGVQPI